MAVGQMFPFTWKPDQEKKITVQQSFKFKQTFQQCTKKMITLLTCGINAEFNSTDELMESIPQTE